MLSIIDVKCPHCGAEGRIILPPMGSIIIGPCPECQGMVAVFCGKVLPLDAGIMLGDGLQEKKEHLLEVLGVFIHDRIEQFFAEQSGEKSGEEPTEDDPEFQPDASGLPGLMASERDHQPISDEEFKSFLNVDLRMIDNRDYFQSVFK